MSGYKHEKCSGFEYDTDVLFKGTALTINWKSFVPFTEWEGNPGLVCSLGEIIFKNPGSEDQSTTFILLPEL